MTRGQRRARVNELEVAPLATADDDLELEVAPLAPADDDPPKVPPSPRRQTCRSLAGATFLWSTGTAPA